MQPVIPIMAPYFSLNFFIPSEEKIHIEFALIKVIIFLYNKEVRV